MIYIDHSVYTLLKFPLSQEIEPVDNGADERDFNVVLSSSTSKNLGVFQALCLLIE